MSGVLKWPGETKKFAKLQQNQVDVEFEQGLDINLALDKVLGEAPLDGVGWSFVSPLRDVLDVGGGIGRAIYHMNKRWNHNLPFDSLRTHFWLLDDEGDSQHHGINDTLTDETFYSNHEAAFEWLVANGVDCDTDMGRNPVEYLDAKDRQGCIKQIRDANVCIDLVTSFRAVGFHWPMHPMLGFLEAITRPGSLLLYESRPLVMEPYPNRRRFWKAYELVTADLKTLAIGADRWQLVKFQHVQVGPHLRAYVLARRIP